MSAGTLYALCLGVCAGLALGLLAPGMPGIAFALLGIGCVLAYSSRAYPRLFFASLLLIASVIGIARSDAFLFGESSQTVQRFADTTAVVRGTVINDPEERASGLFVHMKTSFVNRERHSGTLLVVVPNGTELFYGDALEVRGLVELPESFETDTGRIFDYANYLRAHAVAAVMYRAAVRDVEEGQWSLQGSLYSLKHIFEEGIERVFNAPRSDLLMGILLGEKRGLPEPMTHAFIVAGLIHVVVLSGYNIAIVAEAMLRTLRTFLPHSLALGAGAVAIVLFALMAGAGAATVRATIMGLIALLSRYLRRPSAALRALALAATLMALWNPLALLYDPGFQLSVLATFGLVTLSPAVETRLTFFPERFGVRSIAASTLAVQLFILPALLYMSGILSPFAFVANLLALPVIPLTMLLGATAGALALLHPLLGLVPALAADMLLRWVSGVATMASSMPLAGAVVPAFPLYGVGIAYVPLIALALRLYRKEISEAPQSVSRIRSS